MSRNKIQTKFNNSFYLDNLTDVKAMGSQMKKRALNQSMAQLGFNQTDKVVPIKQHLHFHNNLVRYSDHQ